MRQIWIVFLYTLKDAARKKAFKISTVILLLVVLSACLIANVSSQKADEGDGGAAAEAAG